MHTHTHMYLYVRMTRFVSTNPIAVWANLPYFQILSPGGGCMEEDLYFISNVNVIPLVVTTTLFTTIGF